MAADQRKKRLSSATTTGGSLEQHRAKRKNLGREQNKINFKSHISLKWDGYHKKVIAKSDQVGISWRHLRPFVGPNTDRPSYLADVISVPQEIFELENLKDALSYEVWNNDLSENERNQLLQFLPRGSDSDTEQVVQALLGGDNLHFGNQFLKWSSSLCGGDLHPDAVISHERRLKADKKAYYSELGSYHDGMIHYLLKLKERWTSCKDAESEIMQKKWRLRNEADGRVPSHLNDYGYHELDENVGATSESYSIDEKACSSDHQNSLTMKGGELQKGMYNKGLLKDKFKSPMNTSDIVLKPGSKSRGDKLLKQNIQCTDGTKYMSYVKISKKQHELVKNMKQPGKSFQSKSLNRVLGNIDTSQVHPYEVFVEEERKKLHEHWLRLGKHDLPAAVANRKGRQLQVQQVMKDLDQELKTKIKLVEEDNLRIILPEQKDVRIAKPSWSEDEQGSVPCSSQGQDSENGDFESHQNQSEEVVEEEETEEGGEEVEKVRGEEEEEEEGGGEGEGEEKEDEGSKSLQNQFVDDEKSFSRCPQDFNGQDYNGTCFSPLKDNQKTINVESTRGYIKPDDNSPNVLMYSGNLNTEGFAVGQELPLSSGEDVWPANSVPQSYFSPAVSHDYTSSSGMPVHSKVGVEPQTQLMDLHCNLHKEDITKDVLEAQPNDASFSSFPNQDRNELLQSFYKDAGTILYLKEQKQVRTGFQPQNNVLVDERQFPAHFQQLPQMSLPTEQHQKGQNVGYIQRNSSENVYSQGHGFLTSGQEPLRPVNFQPWNVGPVLMSTPLEPHLNGEFPNQSWFPNETRTRSGWTGPDGACIQNQSIGNGNMDQSLFSVLSHCSQIRTASFYEPTSSAPQLVSRNYGVGSGICPSISSALPQTVHSLDYVSGGRGAAPSLMTDETMWMPHQNPSSNDSMGKSFLKHWGQ